MNTLSIPRGLSERAAGISAGFAPRNAEALPRRRPAEWLPVPQSPCRRPYADRQQRARSVLGRHARVTVGTSLPERLMLASLVLASALGVGYGFSCLVDLVQNWAVFGAGVQRLVQ